MNQAFRVLAESGPQQAPPHVETALRSAFRARRLRGRIALCSPLAIAAVLLLMMIARQPVVEPPEPRLARIGVPQVPIAAIAAKGLLHRPRIRKVRPKPSQEVATRFLPIPGAADAPFDYGAVFRVELPRSAMRVVGLPVNESRLSESIRADVLIGQDGLARAVRFIQ